MKDNEPSSSSANNATVNPEYSQIYNNSSKFDQWLYPEGGHDDSDSDLPFSPPGTPPAGADEGNPPTYNPDVFQSIEGTITARRKHILDAMTNSVIITSEVSKHFGNKTSGLRTFVGEIEITFDSKT